VCKKFYNVGPRFLSSPESGFPADPESGLLNFPDYGFFSFPESGFFNFPESGFLDNPDSGFAATGFAAKDFRQSFTAASALPLPQGQLLTASDVVSRKSSVSIGSTFNLGAVWYQERLLHRRASMEHV
jgi:hypothetical protein